MFWGSRDMLRGTSFSSGTKKKCTFPKDKKYMNNTACGLLLSFSVFVGGSKREQVYAWLSAGGLCQNPSRPFTYPNS